MRDRRSEQRVELVSDELRDGAFEALDLGAQQAHDLVDEQLRALGAECLADGRRAHDVGEENRDDAALSDYRHGKDCRRQGVGPGTTRRLFSRLRTR